MKNLLILSLGTPEELNYACLEASRLDYQHRTVLTLKKNEKQIPSIYKNFSFFFIDQIQLKKSKNSPLIPSAFSINLLWKQLKPILTNKWDSILCLKNCELSKLITPFIDSDHFEAIGYDHQGDVYFSNFKQFIFNHEHLVNSFLLEKNLLSSNNPPDIETKNNTKNDNQYLEGHFANIRTQCSELGFRSIMGIDLASLAYQKCDLVQLVTRLYEKRVAYPLLILRKNNPVQKNVATLINSFLNINLLSIEYEPEIVHTIYPVFDYLLSSNGVLQDISTLLGKNSILLVNQQETSFNSIGIKEDDIAIIHNQSLFEAEDIENALIKLRKETNKFPLHRTSSTIIQFKLSSNLLIPHFKSGESINSLNSKIAKIILNKIVSGREQFEQEVITSEPPSLIKSIVKDEYNHIQLYSKQLLKTIKSLDEYKNSKSSNFLIELDHLLEIKTPIVPIQIIHAHLGFKIDQIKAKGPNAIAQIEKSLFEFKGHLKWYLSLTRKIGGLIEKQVEV
jgi:hypothetical protein